MDIWKSKGKCDPAGSSICSISSLSSIPGSKFHMKYLPAEMIRCFWNFTSQWRRSIQNNNSPLLLVNSLRLLDDGAFFYLPALVEWTEDRLLNVQAQDIFVSEVAGMIQSTLDSLYAILADSAA
ncbi:hypothetical protein M422DRAFT_31636 [Sphaerobolus stellatus SS14]|uniref:Uncharacterized protein n=1 Tax=Sphaerobolus stellatus (strain SS14) TaxID=990650 RepID=A0A0C9UFU6_SPHS4|nr:hypothetical protein M422DRAFT_31636 [Sphaerobolus stellatus SS14]